MGVDPSEAVDGRIRADRPEALWVQAAELISRRIREGSLSAGARLPAERELCQELGISRVTLRKALGHLVEAGLLSPSHGRGWYVSGGPPASATAASTKEWPNSLESFSETAARMGLPSTSQVLEATVAPATIDEGETLQVAPGTPLFHLERVRLLGGVPIAVDRDTVPTALVPRHADADFRTDSLYAVLADHDVRPVRADSTVEAVAASEDLAVLLDLEPGRPVLVLSQLVVDADDRPVMSSVIRYRGDRYRLRTQFARTAARRPG